MLARNLIALACIGMGLNQVDAEIAPGLAVPARTLPVPSQVSPFMQYILQKPLRAKLLPPTTTDGWLALIAEHDQATRASLFARSSHLFPVSLESQQISGVPVYIVSPENIPKKNQPRVLLHVHAGGYIFNAGVCCVPEAMAIAHYGQIKVISVDYRMPPKHPFPAALEDLVQVYNEVIKDYKSTNVGIVSTSSGAGLAASLILKLQELKVDLPAAVSLGSPWADLTSRGDSIHSHYGIDMVLVDYHDMAPAAIQLYAGSHPLNDPYLSPVYATFTSDFPPTILTSGTRDLLLSDAIVLHRKLRVAGVNASLQIFEGMSHAFHLLIPEAPESKEAYGEIVGFFDKHLGSQ